MAGLAKAFKKNSIFVSQFKIGVKKTEIKNLISRFGNITKMKTVNIGNGRLAALVKYNDAQSMEKAIKKGNIKFRGVKVIITRAFDILQSKIEAQKEKEEEDPRINIGPASTIQNSIQNTAENQQNLTIKVCNCCICNDEVLGQILEIQREIIHHARSIHQAEIKKAIGSPQKKKLIKSAVSDLKYIYKKIKNSFD